MIDHLLIQSGYLITTTTDLYGDQSISNQTLIKLKFREITDIARATNIEEIDTADAIIWVDGSLDVAEGMLISTGGAYYRIKKIVKARNFNSTSIQFQKLFVKKHDVEVAS